MLSLANTGDARRWVAGRGLRARTFATELHVTQQECRERDPDPDAENDSQDQAPVQAGPAVLDTRVGSSEPHGDRILAQRSAGGGANRSVGSSRASK